MTRDINATGFADRLQQQAAITGTGNVNIAVDEDIYVIGGSMEAGGDLAIAAGGNIDVVAAQSPE
ncbi:hemagglutinin repeat-containing protein [Devosia sp.]|uniref:hemagglutinin repeat-containing protein n=1 Tax=Devosia sp. TaxID=1871048 RepID=UPI002FCB0D4C